PVHASVEVHTSSMAVAFGVFVAGLFVVVAFTIVLHEAVHGLFFWLLTRSIPRFGFRGWYAYAAAPGWFLPRAAFVAVGLAPLLATSVVGLALTAVLPQGLVTVVLLALIFNAMGSVGDMYLVWRVLRAPRRTVVEDRGAGIAWYVPAPRRGPE